MKKFDIVLTTITQCPARKSRAFIIQLKQDLSPPGKKSQNRTVPEWSQKADTKRNTF